MVEKIRNQVMRLSLQERTKKENLRLHNEKVRLESLSDEELMFCSVELKSSYEYKKNIFSFILVLMLVLGVSNVWQLPAEFANRAYASLKNCTVDDISTILTVFCLFCVFISATIFAMIIWNLKSMRATHQLLLIVEEIKTKPPMEKQFEEAEKSDEYNLRYSLDNRMRKLYGDDDSEDEIKIAKLIGIPAKSLSDLVHSRGLINEDEFKLICNYLNPDSNLASRWRHMYVIKDERRYQP